MSSDTKEQDEKGIDRRHFLMAGAVGAAGIAAAGLKSGQFNRKRNSKKANIE